ncbi:probable protein phosphatase 2C 33 isoform X2 [Syzygium oleosum]|uniref:probable protein phosphatase 2C 33 isoform X2 n=1 Tax=Syzygium oleosum TaxID=219896 RepID=UPI0024B9A827|nr:probable protein phosphatase 2C 33 isoform X2 [Syzygium oleosum]
MSDYRVVNARGWNPCLLVVAEREFSCVAALECLISIIRALRMGSCLSVESRSPVPGSPISPARGVRKRKNSKKRPGLRNSSFDYRREESLHRIPGRLFLNGSSETACLFTQQGRKGTNQDAMIVWENFCSRKDTVFCGVFDGHGPYGHMAAKRVRDLLPLKLSAHWEVSIKTEDALSALTSINSEDTASISLDEESRVSTDLEETEKHPEVFQALKKSFLKAFKIMDRELRVHADLDCFCSGTTAVTLVKQGRYLVIGNVGDSRAALGTRDVDNSLIAVQLTVDLKPNLPERIRKCRGRVFSLQDEPEVARVWLPNNDSPGLAMARAFGDFCLKDFGLISVPEISYRCLTEQDEFVVLATDGVWDVLSNKEVVDIVASAPARSSAARTLVESAVRAWKCKYPTSKVDDCAAVCLFLDSDNLSTASNLISKEQLTLRDQVDTSSNRERVVAMADLCGSDVMVEVGKGCMSKHEEMDSKSEKDWSALEGVSRVNTLLTLPRFVAQKEIKAVRDARSLKES